MEDRIRQLCLRAIAEQSPEKFSKVIGELRAELHVHMESLRKRLGTSDLVERRSRHMRESGARAKS
jgi:hypothetical protein